jgi:hypothetical protein
VAARSGASSGAQILYVRNLRELRKEMKQSGTEWPKEMARGHRDLARLGARWAQSEARAMGGVQSRAAAAIKGKGSQVEALIYISPSGRTAMANVAFWGAKRQTGWYGAFRYRDSATPQHDTWVGNTWDVAVRGQGPYAINWALAKRLPEIDRIYAEMVERVFRDAFPD